MTPSYLIDPVPKPRNHLYGFRLTNVIPSPPCRTERFQKSFYPDVINCWNNIGSNFRDTPTLPLFKSKILKIYRPVKKSIFGIHNPHGTRYIYQLRVGLSGLKSHKKSHNFSDTPDDKCSCSTGSVPYSLIKGKNCVLPSILYCPIWHHMKSWIYLKFYCMVTKG